MEPRPDVELTESDSLRLGRVHVVLEPGDMEVEDASQGLEVTARFAFVQGMDEEFVRARIDMPVLPQDILRPSDCGVTDQLVAQSNDSEVEYADPRELQLVDAGDLSVHLPGARVDVPLSLVPDLLPYMSGVEYLYYSDAVPALPETAASLTIEAGGSQAGELPPFAVEGSIPGGLDLTVTDEDLAELVDDALVLRWRSSGEDSIVVRLTPLLGGEQVSDELTCVLPDAGASRLDLTKLRTLGLPTAADGLRIEASRFSTSTFDVGEFTATELLVERRDRLSVPLR